MCRLHQPHIAHCAVRQRHPHSSPRRSNTEMRSIQIAGENKPLVNSRCVSMEPQEQPIAVAYLPHCGEVKLAPPTPASVQSACSRCKALQPSPEKNPRKCLPRQKRENLRLRPRRRAPSRGRARGTGSGPPARRRTRARAVAGPGKRPCRKLAPGPDLQREAATQRRRPTRGMKWSKPPQPSGERTNSPLFSFGQTATNAPKHM